MATKRLASPWRPDIQGGLWGESQLHFTSQIQEIIKRGKRVGNNYLTICYCIGSGEERRLGLAFGKRAGPPVVRNRVKRILREHFRLSYDRFKAGLGMVVIAQGDLSVLSSKEIIKLYEALLRQARLLNRC